MITLSIDAEGLREARRAFARLPGVLDDELERAVRDVSRAVVREVRQSHTYRNRTGRLTRSLLAYEPVGTFSGGTLEGMVGARTHYASYVEDGTTRMRAFQYLGTAWTMQLGATEARINDALERALRRVGG